MGRDCSNDTLHGAFIDISVHSEDSLIRKVSRFRVRQSMEIAQEMGVRGVVFHTGLLASFNDEKYRESWLEANVEFWTDILEEYKNQSVYMENMFDWNSRELVQLTKAMRNSDRFGICFDYAHAAVFGQEDSPEIWFQETAPYIRHMHINDNDLVKDMHLPLEMV
ncbi:MAG: TIM barrel protein [Lachnospiraceae bacterium]